MPAAAITPASPMASSAEYLQGELATARALVVQAETERAVLAARDNLASLLVNVDA